MRVRSVPVIAVLGALTLSLIFGACNGATAPTLTSTASPSAQITASPTASPSATPTASPTVPPTPSAPPSAPGVTGSPASPTDNDVPPAAGTDPDLSRVATGEAPEGWKDVGSPQGTCRISVPPDWDTTLIPNTGGIFPSVQAGLNEQPTGVWTQLAQTLKGLYFGPDRQVLQSDDRIFLMRAGPSGTDLSYLLAMQNGATTCVVLAAATGQQRETYRETLHQILYTLAAGG